jgi:cytochrome c553
MKLEPRHLYYLIAVVGLVSFGRSVAAGNRREKEQDRQREQAAHKERVERGKYLVTYGGCADCHTPKIMSERGPVDDPARHLAGHPQNANLPTPPKLGDSPWNAATAGLTAWSGPWGVTYAANLTPDVNTGMGIWTEEMFIKSLRTGKHMGSGRPILPPMPWPTIGTLKDDDMKAVFAYLKSIPAVSNRVPEPLGPDGKPAFE